MAEGAGDADFDTPGYVPPKPKKLDEIVNLDKDDESLEKYKKQLLGDVCEEVFPNDPRKVIVTKLALLVEGRDDLELDLTDTDKIKDKTFVLKEGIQYKIRIYFYVQREIVTGLRYYQKSYRKGIPVDKDNFMVGSYGPKKELQSYTTPVDEAPSGMIARGTYTIKSSFTDDDKHDHLTWEWSLEIKKDWKE